MDTRKSLIQSNMENYWRQTSKTSYIDFESSHEAVYAVSSSAEALLNSVLSVNLSHDSAESTVIKLEDLYSQQGKSFCWWVSPNQDAVKLTESLVSHHFVCEGTIQGMVLPDLSKANLEYMLPEGVEIKPATFASDLDDWIQPIKVSFGLSDEAADSYKSIFKELMHQATDVEHFIAYRNAKAVSSCSIFLDKTSHTAGVYNCGTVPEFRKQGICSALTRHGLFNAQQKGFDTAVLQASEFSQKLFKETGFEDCAEYKLYHK